MEHAIFEIVKEYCIDVIGLEFAVIGRVLKRISQNDGLDYQYEWEISHYCKPSESAMGVYIPSSPYGNTFETTESFLLAYLKSFTTMGVTLNEQY